MPAVQGHSGDGAARGVSDTGPALGASGIHVCSSSSSGAKLSHQESLKPC